MISFISPSLTAKCEFSYYIGIGLLQSTVTYSVYLLYVQSPISPQWPLRFVCPISQWTPISSVLSQASWRGWAVQCCCCYFFSGGWGGGLNWSFFTCTIIIFIPFIKAPLSGGSSIWSRGRGIWLLHSCVWKSGMGQFHMEFSEEEVTENCWGIYCG